MVFCYGSSGRLMQPPLNSISYKAVADSQREMILLHPRPQGHLAISGDSLNCHNGGQECYKHLVGQVSC